MLQFISAGKTEALRVSVPLNRMDMSDQEERGERRECVSPAISSIGD